MAQSEWTVCHYNHEGWVVLASSPALSPAFLHEFEKSWGRPGNEARVVNGSV